eukprot:5466923-Lingulodinium_polyedra.AAC.1
MDAELLWELVSAALTLPLAVMRLGEASAPWCPRVVCFDAAPGGHGAAYASVAVDEVQRWAQRACHKGSATTLDELH